jgi:hypothetical protein
VTVSRIGSRNAGLVLVTVLVAACSTTTASPAPPTGGLASPIAVPISSPSGSPPPAVSANPPSVTPGQPGAIDAPAAVLVVNGERFAGTVGGYSFRTYSQSAPWLPATALKPVGLAANAGLVVKLDASATVESWGAAVATAADSSGDSLSTLGEGTGPARFTGPAAGDWVISVLITYAGGLGSGAYFWHLVVS